MELRGTRVLLDAGLSLAASARLVQREVGDGDGDDGEGSKSKPKSKSSSNLRRAHTTGKGEFLISAPAFRTALFEVRSMLILKGVRVAG